jgi:hypothetical protein
MSSAVGYGNDNSGGVERYAGHVLESEEAQKAQAVTELKDT